jgi:hypothetical protein
MTVKMPVLDDLRWDDLVRIARDHLPAASGGYWTLHSPIDPGVTILETYAWQLEERLFRLGTPPDSVFWQAIRLLDLEGPLEAATAFAVAECRSARSTTLTDGNDLTLPGGGGPTNFRVSSDTLIVGELAMTSVRAGGRPVDHELDRVEASANRSGSTLLTDDEMISLEVDLASTDLPFNRARWISLFLHLDPVGSSTSPIGWVDDVATPPHFVVDNERSELLGPPVSLTWTLATRGTTAHLDVRDGTDGFRHSGIVSFRTDQAPGNALTLSVTSNIPWHGAEPRLRRVVPNAIIVGRARTTTVETRPTRDDPLSRQLATLKPLPNRALDLETVTGTDRFLTPTLTLDVVEIDGQTHRWTPVEDLALATPTDRAFVYDPEAATLTFGDDLHGRVPRLSSRYEGVLHGTLGAGSVTGPAAQRRTGLRNWYAFGSVAEATLLTTVAGGRDRQSIRDWSSRPHQPRSRRIVTPEDARQAALDSPGKRVARAFVAVGFDPNAVGYTVDDTLTVFCVGHGRTKTLADLKRQPFLDTSSVAAVQRLLESRRIVGTRLITAAAVFRPVSLHIDLTIRPGCDREAVRSELEKSLRLVLHPSPGPAASAWPFGGAISPVALALLAADAVTDEAEIKEVTICVFPPRDCFGTTINSSCDPITLAPYELPWLTTIEFRDSL